MTDQPDPRPVYPTEEKALARVEVLKRSGIWPGVLHVAGGWVLTYDPREDL
jgi:hypothetical protein